jgi:large subunit ribosomal protein L35
MDVGKHLVRQAFETRWATQAKNFQCFEFQRFPKNGFTSTPLVDFFAALFPMNKTKKSIAKRFKVTGTGKVIFRKAGKRHMLRNKNTKQKRRMCQDQVMASDKMARNIKHAMSPGL